MDFSKLTGEKVTVPYKPHMWLKIPNDVWKCVGCDCLIKCVPNPNYSHPIPPSHAELDAVKIYRNCNLSWEAVSKFGFRYGQYK